MSSLLVSRNPDLKRLRDEGFEVEIKANYLLVHHIPYVTVDKEVHYSTLASELTMSGDSVGTPSTHVIKFTGSDPCDQHGVALDIICERTETVIDGELTLRMGFSFKPTAGYANYYDKVLGYYRILAGPAQVLDPTATGQTHAPALDDDEDSPFVYLDTASSRADMAAVTDKLRMDSLAIIGVGGTGSYILDLVAKTPVRAIHLFDRDTFYSHNAFRAPGAAGLDELRKAPRKVNYLSDMYSAMHQGIVPHGYAIDETNVHDLDAMGFVFVAMDAGPTKKLILEHLESAGIAFVDVGMGLYNLDGSIGGSLRVTTSLPSDRSHIWEKDRIPFEEEDEAGIYHNNIQVADLNALNAALAVIRWKKWRTFYQDLEGELTGVYTIDGNHLLNEDQTR